MITTQVPESSAMMRAWKQYQASEEYANTMRWLERGSPTHGTGELWAAFNAGYCAAGGDPFSPAATPDIKETSMPRPDELDRVEPLTAGDPLDTLVKRERAHQWVRELAKDLEFAIDVTEPRDVIIARFEDCIKKALTARLAAPEGA